MNKKTRAEKWAEAYLNSEEGKEILDDFKQSFLDWVILGKTMNCPEQNEGRDYGDEQPNY